MEVSRRRTLNLPKIASGAVVGMIVGGIYCLVGEVAKMETKSDRPLDPPAPNMEEVNGEMANSFRTFMGSFHKICPKQNRDEFTEHVRVAIENAEMVMVIENQFRKKEIPIRNGGRQEINESTSYYKESMKSLRSSALCFNTTIVEKVISKIDHIGIHLQDSLMNIRNFADSK